MNFDSIMSLLQDFDPSAIIPELDTVLGWVELATRLAVLAGPLVLLLLGLLYFLAPPKEANHHVGFRALFGMGGVEAWQYTQRLSGICCGGLGLVLTVVMGLICSTFSGAEAQDMVETAITCLWWELGLIALCYAGINIAVLRRYDWKGNRRQQKK